MKLPMKYQRMTKDELTRALAELFANPANHCEGTPAWRSKLTPKMAKLADEIAWEITRRVKAERRARGEDFIDY